MGLQNKRPALGKPLTPESRGCGNLYFPRPSCDINSLCPQSPFPTDHLNQYSMTWALQWSQRGFITVPRSIYSGPMPSARRSLTDSREIRAHGVQISTAWRKGWSQVNSEELKNSYPGLHPNLLPAWLKHALTQCLQKHLQEETPGGSSHSNCPSLTCWLGCKNHTYQAFPNAASTLWALLAPVAWSDSLVPS